MDNDSVIRIFYGDGKGKTSAALGSAFKSLDTDEVAYIVLFNKDETETALLEKFEPEIKVFEFDRDMAVNFVKKVMSSKECQILVLDEILSLLNESEAEDMILELMDLQESSQMTLMLTGQCITEKIKNKANYITEFTMRS